MPYLFVLLGSFLVDVLPVPLPPAFVVMIYLQLHYDLQLWSVIPIGVAGSILGRWVLTLYIPRLTGKLFTRAKNEDVQLLGRELKHKGWKGQLFIFLYCLMPLPSTPLFLAAGMARVKPLRIIPAFTIGKFSSDLVAVLLGAYAAQNTPDLLHGLVSWKSIAGLVIGLVLVFALLFVDWRELLHHHRFVVSFRIGKGQRSNHARRKDQAHGTDRSRTRKSAT